MVSLNSTKWTVYLSLLFVICICQETVGLQRLCGEALSEVLEGLCKQGLAKKILNKKSVVPALQPVDYYSEIEEDDGFGLKDFPFLSKIDEGIADFLTKTRRRRQGVADDCCRKGCTYSELAKYCQNYEAAAEMVKTMT